MHFLYSFFNSNRNTAVGEYHKWFPQWRIADQYVFSAVHCQIHQSGLFFNVSFAEHPVTGSGKGKNIIQITQHSPYVSSWRISATPYPCMRVWQHYTVKGLYCNQQIQHLEPGNMGRWLKSYCWFDAHSTDITISYSLTRHSLPMMYSTIPQAPICGQMKIHEEQ